MVRRKRAGSRLLSEIYWPLQWPAPRQSAWLASLFTVRRMRFLRGALVAEYGIVEVEESAVVTVIRLQGEFDLGNSLELEGAVLAAVDRCLPLIVDFAEDKVLDSTGIRALVMPRR